MLSDLTGVLAQFDGGLGGGGVAHFVVVAIVVCAVLGIGWVAVRASGLPIPAWAVQIFWIVVVAVMAIFAIRFLLSIA